MNDGNPSTLTTRASLGLGTAALVADSSLVHIAGAETITGEKLFTANLSCSTSFRRVGTGFSDPGGNGVDVAGDCVVLFTAYNQDSRIGVDAFGYTWMKSINPSSGGWKFYVGTANTLSIQQWPSGGASVGTVAADPGAGSFCTQGTVRVGQYTVATLPAAGLAGRIAFATNGRKNGEGSGAGTGVQVYDDGTAWRRVSDDTTVAA